MKDLYDNTILIVDDTPENIHILLNLLEDFDNKVADNGKKALEIAFSETPPDLILLDIMMPEMDGYEVCCRLREDDRTKAIPVIFLTSKSLQDDIVRGFEVGGQDYITKPFDARELMERVKTQLELKTQREILKNMNVVLEEKVQERTAQLNEANRELQGLDEAKNNFLSMISHEIRTPLNGIMGASYFLNSELSEDKELGEFVEMLQISADRLEHFSTTALLITQLQTDYSVLKEKTALFEIIETCINENEEIAKPKGITLINESSDNHITINIDKKLISRALNSIINNAVKYSNQKGEVRLKAFQQDQNVIIDCYDIGRGFTQEALDNLFKPFGLGEKHYDQSVGLSLKAAKQIMEVHGGDIQIKNQEEGGACVSLIF